MKNFSINLQRCELDEYKKPYQGGQRATVLTSNAYAQAIIEVGGSFVPRRSAGLVMYRRRRLQDLEVFLVHPGGPHFAKKDLGIWTIPKGEYRDGEQPLEAAKREFHEETSFVASGDFFDLGWIKQKGGKIVTAWGFEGDCDPGKLISNTCEVEWPPKSGRLIEVPEIDRGSWFSLDEAKERIKSTQIPLLDRLAEALDSGVRG